MRKITTLLFAAALIAAMVGCGGNGGNIDNGGDVDNGGDGANGGESYTLTIDSTAGGMVAVDDSGITGRTVFTYEAGTVVVLTATPNSGYRFVRWTGDVVTVGDVHASQIAVTVNGSYFIVAKFEVPPPIRYSLSIFAMTGGSVTKPGENGFTYDAGAVVSLVATPSSGYEFAGWTGDVDTIASVNAASTTITMNGNYYICAHFRDIPCPGAG